MLALAREIILNKAVDTMISRTEICLKEDLSRLRRSLPKLQHLLQLIELMLM